MIGCVRDRLWIVLVFGVFVTAPTARAQSTICLHVRMYERTGAEKVLDRDEAYPKDGPVISRWTELGYRVVRPCAGAQYQVELQIRFSGASRDPRGKVKLAVVGKSFGRLERAEIPYNGGFRDAAERARADSVIAPAAADILLNLDPTYSAKAAEYRRKHPESQPMITR
jgi:hypothetical protein